MRVFINGRFGSQEVTGVQRYAGELLRAVDAELGRGGSEAGGASYRILAPRNATRIPTLKHIPVQLVGRLTGHAWEQLELPWYARGGFLVNLANTGPLVVRNQTVTIHDAAAFAVPEAYSPAFRHWYQRLLPALGRVARKVVTDSEFSKAELIRYAGIPSEKLHVIPLGGEHILRIEADCGILERLGVRPRGYLLAVSSHSPHKNFRIVVEALEELGTREFQVVVVGGQNTRIFQRSDVIFGPGFKLSGYVADGELRALYENAACFIYPSLYEGFGLPPLEAMSCGCPVIASREASMPEVCGDAVLYVDVRTPSSVAEGIALVMGDDRMQEHLRTAGHRRAAQFTWSKSAGALMTLLRELGT